MSTSGYHALDQESDDHDRAEADATLDSDPGAVQFPHRIYEWKAKAHPFRGRTQIASLAEALEGCQNIALGDVTPRTISAP